jgi:ABC-2 type transport system permease protein
VSIASKHPTGFIAALAREVAHYRHQSGDLLLSVFFLLASMIVVAWIFTSGTLTNLPIAVIDQDGTSVSRAYVRMIEATPEMRVTEYVTSLAAARELIEQASIYAAVLIPRNFGKDIRTSKQVTVVGWHSGQFLTISAVISKSLRQVTATLSAGIEMTSLAKRGDSALAAQVNFEPIRPELRTLFNPFQNYQYFLVAGLLPAMLQVFVMSWSVFVVGREFRDGTSAAWLTAGTMTYAAVAAKMLPVFIVASAIGLGCLGWVHGIVGWPVTGSLGVLIVGWALMILAYITLGLLAAGFAPTLATALSFTAAYTAPAFAYAGITFPQQGMPLLAELWSYALPVQTLLSLQVEQTQIGAPVRSSVSELLILTAFILLPLPLALRKIRLRCETSVAEHR